MQEKIVYKVVEKRTRHGTNMTMFLNNIPDFRKHRYKRIKKFIPEYLRPRYLKGRTIKAHPHTVGLMCFKTVDYAKSFIYDYSLQSTSIVIKVRGILRKNQNVTIIPHCGTAPQYLLIMKNSMMMRPPYGTVFCDIVEVLE